MPSLVAAPVEKDSPLIFYLPCLNRELVTGLLPQEVFFLNPGLPLSAEIAESGRRWTPDGLPYEPSVAAACLRDLLAEGERLGHDLLLSAGAGERTDMLPAPGAAFADSSERAALRDFARTGSYTPETGNNSAPTAPSQKAAREQAQKLLLLYAHLEDSILAARKLAREISAGEEVLFDLLRAEEQEESAHAMPPLADISKAGEALLEQGLARWPEVLRAWLALLPPEVVFYTADLAALPGLEAEDVRPLPPEEAARLFSASVNAGWSFVAIVLNESCGRIRLVSGQSPEIG